MHASQRHLLIFALFAFTSSCLFGQTSADNITIAVHSDYWRCDRIECPLESEQCVVYKIVNAEKLVRKNLCLSSKSGKLAGENFDEIPTNRDNNLLIISTKDDAIVVREPKDDTNIDDFEQNAELMRKTIEQIPEVNRILWSMPVYLRVNNTQRQSYLT